MSEKTLGSNIKNIRSCFDENSQVVETNLMIGEHEISVFYIDGLIDKTLFSQSVLLPLEKLTNNVPQTKNILKHIKTKVVSAPGVQDLNSSKEAVDKILAGS